MKTHRILCLCAALAVPQAALAELPFTPVALGAIQSMIDFCTRLNPDAASKYREQAGLLVRGAAEEEVAMVRSLDEYKEGYASTSAELAKVAGDDAANACNDLLATDARD